MALTAPGDEILDRLLAGLPVGWSALPDVDPAAIDWRFAVMLDDDYGYRVRDDAGIDTVCGELDLAIGLMRKQLRRFVGYHSKDLVFVHAGVVAHHGRAIVIPGHSFSGKSTLVAALVRAGAVYYSDEYAVLDRAGRVHPYREPLAMRDRSGIPSGTLSVEELGGEAGDDAIPIALVALLSYVAGTDGELHELSSAQGVFAVLEHAIPVQDRPEETLSVIRQALAGATVLTGERGEAQQIAKTLLETV